MRIIVSWASVGVMLALLSLAGCNTVEGVGRDLEQTGQNISTWAGGDGDKSY